MIRSFLLHLLCGFFFPITMTTSPVLDASEMVFWATFPLILFAPIWSDFPFYSILKASFVTSCAILARLFMSSKDVSIFTAVAELALQWWEKQFFRNSLIESHIPLVRGWRMVDDTKVHRQHASSLQPSPVCILDVDTVTHDQKQITYQLISRQLSFMSSESR